VQVGGVYRATDPAVADGDVASLRVNAKGEAIVQLSGSKVCLSSEAKPAGEQGDTLLEYDEITGETKVYKYISGDWREL
jgi:hypothetical protein